MVDAAAAEQLGLLDADGELDLDAVMFRHWFAVPLTRVRGEALRAACENEPRVVLFEPEARTHLVLVGEPEPLGNLLGVAVPDARLQFRAAVRRGEAPAEVASRYLIPDD